MTRLAILAIAGLAAAQCAAARPFAVDDLLRAESFGQAAFDPAGRWLVYERRGPHAAAGRFDLEPHSEVAEGRLRLVDLRRGAPARPLVAGDPFGLTLGPVSPDGRRIAVYGLHGASWRLGVATPALRRVRWFKLRPDYPGATRTVQWLSPRTLVAIDRAADGLPRALSLGNAAARRLPARWAAAARGARAATAIGAGRFAGVTPAPATHALVRLDVVTGRAAVLARGAFEDLEVSPDGRRVALVSVGETIPLSGERPLQGDWGTATRRRRLDLLDLASGRLTRVCAACDVLGGLLSWSPSGRRLLVYVRRDGQPWTDGGFLRVEAEPVQATPLALGGATPVLSFRPELARARWLGEIPVVLAETAGGRRDWLAVSDRGPVALTAALTSAPDDLRPGPGGLLGLAGSQLWRLSGDGATRLTGPDGLRPAGGPVFALETRTLVNPPRAAPRLTARRVAGGAAWAVSVSASGDVIEVPLPAPQSRVLAFDAPRRRVVSLVTDARGVQTLSLDQGPRHRTLDVANAGLAAVAPPRVVAVRHAGPGGEPETSWLYLPVGSRADRPPPLVVAPYPGSRFATAPSMEDFGRPAVMPSPPALLGHGYAVLLPSLPREAGADPLAGLADQVLRIVDTAAAQAPGAFDPERLAVWGHSYGGYAAMAMIAQTDRFKAAIEAAGPSDLVSQWGTPAPIWRLDPSQGLGVAWSAGWTEAAQGGMGAPPWRDPMGYVRNSPLFLAGAIHTPLLLLHGDQDEVALGQAEEMFAALDRQDRDALLVTYWGEGHVVRSPGNLRDLYRRAFAWLDGHLSFGPAAASAARSAHPEPAPATTAPSSPPPRR